MNVLPGNVHVFKIHTHSDQQTLHQKNLLTSLSMQFSQGIFHDKKCAGVVRKGMVCNVPQ